MLCSTGGGADYILDLATLTGASVVGMGQYTSSVMGNSEDVVDMVLKGGKISGEFCYQTGF